jgi:pimeloyl-ACP methyl ester carboxylesterase
MIEKRLTIDGLKIAYTEVGPPQGRVVIIVHGLLSNGRDYDALAQALAAHGHRVICLDLPGRGKSDWMPDGALYALPSYIPLCTTFAQQITQGRGFDWIGVSLGGMIGMSLCAIKELPLERLLLVDIGAEIPGPALDEIAVIARAPTIFETRASAQDFLRMRCAGWGITQDTHWAHLFRHNIVDLDDGAARMHYDARIGMNILPDNQDIDFWPIWEQIEQPVLVVRGATSKVLPARVMKEMTARYIGAPVDTMTIKGCGHVPNLMEAEQIEKVREWIAP